MRLLRASFLAPVLLATNACIYFDIDTDSSRFSRDFHFSYPLNRDGHVSVEGLNGPIEITPWDQPTVDVSGSKHARSQTLVDALRVDVDHSPASVSIRTNHPTDARGNYGVRFEIKVPRGAFVDRVATSNGSIHIMDCSGPSRLKSSNGSVRVEKFKGGLDIQTSNNAIELDEIEGAVTARTSNGHIRIDAMRGSLEAETSNNSIKAALLRADRDTRVETRNGSIDLTLPAGLTQDVRARTSNNSITIRLGEPVNARVSAHTSNSEIDSDFEARAHGTLRRGEFEGSIGSGGGPLLDLSSSNGPIRIVRN
jgi:hypothetical protein